MRLADAAMCTSVNWSHLRGWPNLGPVPISIAALRQHCPQAWPAHTHNLKGCETITPSTINPYEWSSKQGGCINQRNVMMIMMVAIIMVMKSSSGDLRNMWNEKWGSLNETKRTKLCSCSEPGNLAPLGMVLSPSWGWNPISSQFPSVAELTPSWQINWTWTF